MAGWGELMGVLNAGLARKSASVVPWPAFLAFRFDAGESPYEDTRSDSCVEDSTGMFGGGAAPWRAHGSCGPCCQLDGAVARNWMRRQVKEGVSQTFADMT